MNATIKRKEISLIFRGFSCPPEFIEETLGIKANSKGIQEMPMEHRIKTILKHSFVKFSIPLNPDTRLDEVVPKIIDALGGVDKLINVRELVNPRLFEMDITWPIKHSEEQEGGFFRSSSIASLAAMKCTLSFSFL